MDDLYPSLRERTNDRQGENEISVSRHQDLGCEDDEVQCKKAREVEVVRVVDHELNRDGVLCLVWCLCLSLCLSVAGCERSLASERKNLAGRGW